MRNWKSFIGSDPDVNFEPFKEMLGIDRLEGVCLADFVKELEYWEGKVRWQTPSDKQESRLFSQFMHIRDAYDIWELKNEVANLSAKIDKLVGYE